MILRLTSQSVFLFLREVIRTPRGILIIQRSKDSEHNPNIWEFPGGGFEGGALKANFRRETREETQIKGNKIGGLEVIEMTVEKPDFGKYKDKIVINIYIDSKNKKDYEVKLSKEHQSHRWVKSSLHIADIKSEIDPVTLEILNRFIVKI